MVEIQDLSNEDVRLLRRRESVKSSLKAVIARTYFVPFCGYFPKALLPRKFSRR